MNRDIKIHGMRESAVLEMQGYAVGAPVAFVPVSQIAQFSQIDYNGNHGTRISLVCGQEVDVTSWPHDIARAIATSSNPPKSLPTESRGHTPEWPPSQT